MNVDVRNWMKRSRLFADRNDRDAAVSQIVDISILQCRLYYERTVNIEHVEWQWRCLQRRREHERQTMRQRRPRRHGRYFHQEAQARRSGRNAKWHRREQDDRGRSATE